MRRIAIPAIIALAASAATGAGAQGRLGLLPTGEYVCALPGSAAGKAWEPQPAHAFAILRASRYRTPTGSGTYLVKGDVIAFTRGPLRGRRMVRVSSTMVRELGNDGEPGRLLCQRTGPIRDD